jgi:hypothetical protein
MGLVPVGRARGKEDQRSKQCHGQSSPQKSSFRVHAQQFNSSTVQQFNVQQFGVKIGIKSQARTVNSI